MLRIKSFIVFLVFSLFCSVQAVANDEAGAERLGKVFKKYLSPNTVVKVNGSMQSVTGDFNGDGFSDVAVVFLPVTEITETDKLQVFMPWGLAGSVAPGGFHRSLAIFHGGREGVLSDVTQVFVLLDNSGALETPSFELLTVRAGGKDYKLLASDLPVEPVGDMIILPTEAGIDTYIYWYKDRYGLSEPEDSP